MLRRRRSSPADRGTVRGDRGRQRRGRCAARPGRTRGDGLRGVGATTWGLRPAHDEPSSPGSPVQQLLRDRCVLSRGRPGGRWGRCGCGSTPPGRMLSAHLRPPRAERVDPGGRSARPLRRAGRGVDRGPHDAVSERARAAPIPGTELPAPHERRARRQRWAHRPTRADPRRRTCTASCAARSPPCAGPPWRRCWRSRWRARRSGAPASRCGRWWPSSRGTTCSPRCCAPAPPRAVPSPWRRPWTCRSPASSTPSGRSPAGSSSSSWSSPSSPRRPACRCASRCPIPSPPSRAPGSSSCCSTAPRRRSAIPGRRARAWSSWPWSVPSWRS